MATNVSDSRIFECEKDDGTKVSVRIRRANRRELEAADLEQSRIFNQALLSGLPPRSRLLRKLREQGLWTAEDDQKLNDLRGKSVRIDARIAQVDKEIGEAAKDANETVKGARELEKESLIKERAVTFRDLNELRVEIDGMLGHTADAKADDAHRNFLLACVAEYVRVGVDSKPTVLGRVWQAVDGLMGEQDTSLLQRVIYEYMTFNAGLTSDWEKDVKAQKELAAEGGAEGGDAEAPGGVAEAVQARTTEVAA